LDVDVILPKLAAEIVPLEVVIRTAPDLKMRGD
jgi:hypothetical protein